MRYTEGGNRKMKMKKKIGKTPPVGKEYIKIFSIRKTVSPPLKEKKVITRGSSLLLALVMFQISVRIENWVYQYQSGRLEYM